MKDTFAQKLRHRIKRIIWSVNYRRELTGGKFLPDRLFIRLTFWCRVGYWPNLKAPQTFNEKINWLKLHDRRPIYTQMVDKYGARTFIAERVGTDLLVPLLGVWDSFEEINFDALPERFVLKCTHDCNSAIIVKDKNAFDIEAARTKLSEALGLNYYTFLREWPYNGVQPRIIAEEHIGDDLRDIKLYAFNGIVRLIQANTGHLDSLKITFHDEKWQYLDFTVGIHQSEGDGQIPKPRRLDEMLEIARLLSASVPFLRLDFLETNEKLYIGELTLYPHAGMKAFSPAEYDRLLGSFLTLPPH